VSLRNYVYTEFASLAEQDGVELVFLNNSPVDLEGLGHQEVKFPKIQLHWKTDALKNAIKHNELNWFKSKSGNAIFDTYKFKWNTKGIKNKLKTALAKKKVKATPSLEYIASLRKKLRQQERKTSYYNNCLDVIKEIAPDLVVCASQRPVAAVAPMEAAKQLGIPTICAIFSWDNLPKGTLVVEADHYLVWSEHMKQELATYYPSVESSTVHITGTPQFENHYNKDLLLNRDVFFNTYKLDPTSLYICFSGDDVTTSPYDPQYLDDVAVAVTKYNELRDKKLGVIFRRCPVDFSDRYDWVLKKHQDVIVPIAPLWKSIGSNWDKKVPTKEDLELQTNIICHTEMVINVGSSMVFDYAAHNKPCAYLNYNPVGSDLAVKDINKIYKYIHFQSMPDKNAVIWLDNKEAILDHIAAVLEKGDRDITAAHEWFGKIVMQPAQDASQRILTVLKSIK